MKNKKVKELFLRLKAWGYRMTHTSMWGDAMTALALFTVSVVILLFTLEMLGSVMPDPRLFRLDSQWYREIVERGYLTESQVWTQKGIANWAFFPLLPMLAKGLFYLGIPAFNALFFVAGIFFFLSILIFIRFVRMHNKDIPPYIAGGVLAFMPFSIYAFTGYSEAPFFFFSILTYMLFKKERYFLAGLSGICLTASRVLGVLLIPALALPLIKKFWKMSRKKQVNIVLSLMMMPLGLAGFMVYLHYHMGDALAFKHVQSVWVSTPTYNPFITLKDGLNASLTDKYFWFALFSLGSFALSAWYAFKKQYTLAIFLFLYTLLPVSIRLFSYARYAFWAFPFTLFLAQVCAHKNWARYLFPVMQILLVFVYYAWMKGASWTI